MEEYLGKDFDQPQGNKGSLQAQIQELTQLLQEDQAHAANETPLLQEIVRTSRNPQANLRRYQ